MVAGSLAEAAAGYLAGVGSPAVAGPVPSSADVALALAVSDTDCHPFGRDTRRALV